MIEERLFGLDDPDWANNTAVAETDVAAPVDIRPRNRRNPVNVKSRGVLPVALLGGPGFDVRDIDRRSLRFGPGESRPKHRKRGHRRDVNHDGYPDLLLHFPLRRAQLAPGDRQACLVGRFDDGRAFSGCDRIRVLGANKRTPWQSSKQDPQGKPPARPHKTKTPKKPK